jgi:hypothetical protein
MQAANCATVAVAASLTTSVIAAKAKKAINQLRMSEPRAIDDYPALQMQLFTLKKIL